MSYSESAKINSYEKGVGAEKVLAILRGGGGAKSFGVFFTLWLEVLAILKGGHKMFYHVLKGGGRKKSLEGGGGAQKVSRRGGGTKCFTMS